MTAATRSIRRLRKRLTGAPLGRGDVFRGARGPRESCRGPAGTRVRGGQRLRLEQARGGLRERLRIAGRDDLAGAELATISPSEPTSVTTTGRRFPIAVANTPDESSRLYGRTTAAARSSARAPRRRAGSRAATRHARPGRPAAPGRADRPRPRAARRDLRQRLEQHVQPLVVPNQSEEEQRAAAGRWQLLALEDRVRDTRDPLPA